MIPAHSSSNVCTAVAPRLETPAPPHLSHVGRVDPGARQDGAQHLRQEHIGGGVFERALQTTRDTGQTAVVPTL